MGENGVRRPAARAIVPPADQSDSAILATAPTLLLTPTEPADTDDAASTSRIATPTATALEEQPWFKTGTTVPPPAMRPMGESLAPPPVRNPSPRVLKVVAGVIAACLFIVAVAGLKLLYKRFRAPAVTQTPSGESTSRTVVATVDLAHPPRSAPDTARPAEFPPTAPQSAAPAVAPPAPATQAAAPHRTTPVRSSPSPARVTTKTTTRRAPTPKKTGRGTH